MVFLAMATRKHLLLWQTFSITVFYTDFDLFGFSLIFFCPQLVEQTRTTKSTETKKVIDIIIQAFHFEILP